MVAVDIRKQGGASVITIPSVLINALHLEVGERLELEVQNGGFVAKPTSRLRKKRYSLSELLEGTTPENMKALNAATDWVCEGEPMGREII